MIFCIAINAFFTPIYERNNFQNCRSPFDTSKIHHPFKNSLHIFTIIIFLYFTVHFDQNNLNFVPSAILYQINHLFTNTISRRANNLYTRTPPIFACKFLNIHRFSHRLLIIRRPFKYGQETRQRRSKQWVILITKLNNRAAN